MRLHSFISTLVLVTSAHVCGVAGPPAHAAGTPAHAAGTTQEAKLAAGDGETLRQRWERMSPDEKRRMRQRFEELRSMTKEERHELMLRAKHLREARARLQAEWPADVRERLERLTPEERRLLLDDFAREETREAGRRIREKLPRDLLLRLETMPPEMRLQAIARFKEAQRARTARALQEMGRRLELTQEEVQRIERLSAEERARALLAMRKRLASAAGKDRASASSPASPRGSAPASPDESRALRALREASRPRAADFYSERPLTPHERREHVSAARRERCLEVLRSTNLVSPQELEELETLPPARFFQRMRQLVAPLDARRDP